MSPKPAEKPKKILDPRAFQMIPDRSRKMTLTERRDQAKQRRDELIAKFGHPKDRKNAR